MEKIIQNLVSFSLLMFSFLSIYMFQNVRIEVFTSRISIDISFELSLDI